MVISAPYGAEMLKLGATAYGADPLGTDKKNVSQKSVCEFLSREGPKRKKNAGMARIAGGFRGNFDGCFACMSGRAASFLS